jgi:Na+/H+ antiporter NhaD/arsenite permease-like protein
MSGGEHEITNDPSLVELSARKFLFGCVIAAVGVWIFGRFHPIPSWVLAVEVLVTIVALFVLGSIKYRLHKNALCYGAALVIVATFCGAETSEFHRQIAAHGWWHFLRHNLLTFEGWDKLVHADTMLFILGLTFFVAVIAQTRLLEGLTFFLLQRNKGRMVPTVVAVTAVVAFASGILDGVSMIGLTIRTLVIILLLAAAPTAAVRYAVMVCTCVTTVCGIWLAYGEPPNLIMKANLHPYLTNSFFLRYCAPAAVASYLVIAWNLRRKLRGEHVKLNELDVLDAHAATVRFLQASRHGEVLTPLEFVEEHEAELGGKWAPVLKRLRHGEPLGLALVRENVPEATRQLLLGKFVSEDLAESLDRHYVLDAAGDHDGALRAGKAVDDAIYAMRTRRVRAQKIGALALIPFVGFLIWHAIDHRVPLFWASFAGFFVALIGIFGMPKMRNLAFREARHEYAEYYFLFPLFLSITLLAKIGFFDQLQDLLHHAIEKAGYAHVAFGQFAGCTVLSAMLDNNVVADFVSRALHGLELGVLHLFALAQIAGYAAGGCWTHIGSAQSVVAYAFIHRNIDEKYTPFQWIKEMTPVILEIVIVLTLVIYFESWLLHVFPERVLTH